MWQFLLSPYGRMSRKTFWLRAALPLLSITIVVALANLRFLTLLTLPVIFWPAIATTTKRLHDRGMTGWWTLAPILFTASLAAAGYWYNQVSAPNDPSKGAGPMMIILILVIFGAGVMLYLLFNTLVRRGQPGTNRYGPDPFGAAQAEVFA